MAHYVVHNCYLALGWICFAIGSVGIFVPGLPTTIFWILALWAFTKSSPKMRRYLLQHPKFGKILREWNDHRIVPVVGKIAATLSMGIVCIVSVITMHNVMAVVSICFTLSLVIGYIVTRPSHLAEVSNAQIL